MLNPAMRCAKMTINFRIMVAKIACSMCVGYTLVWHQQAGVMGGGSPQLSNNICCDVGLGRANVANPSPHLTATIVANWQPWRGGSRGGGS